MKAEAIGATMGSDCPPDVLERTIEAAQLGPLVAELRLAA